MKTDIFKIYQTQLSILLKQFFPAPFAIFGDANFDLEPFDLEPFDLGPFDLGAFDFGAFDIKPSMHGLSAVPTAKNRGGELRAKLSGPLVVQL